MLKTTQNLIDEKYIIPHYYTLNDPKFIATMVEAPWPDFAHRLGDEDEIVPEYKQKMFERLNSTQINNLEGLERFECQDIIHGVTQSFDEIYYRYCKRRLRIFQGEYTYHRRSFPNWKFIDEKSGDIKPLDKNDYVILSLPFAGNGNCPPNLEYVLDECHKNQIPVMVDCAWFGTCYGMNFDFNHPGITEVSFSLSKGLGLGKVRSGIRYSNFKDDPFPIRHQNNATYLPLIAMQLGMYMMERIPVDQIPTRYKGLQERLCQSIGIENSSKCIHVATPSKSDHRWKNGFVSGSYYKLGIKHALQAMYSKEISV